MQDAFDAATEKAEAAHWIWDGVHPTAAGRDVIAKRWLEVAERSGLWD